MLLSVLVILASVIVYAAISQNSPEPQADPQAAEKPQSPPEAVVQSYPTMLELGSEGCIPCEQMKPVMAKLREEHGDLIRIEFHDVRKNQSIAQKYRIRLIPTQVFLKTDGTEFFRHEGFFPKEEIEKVFRDMGVPL